MKLQKTVGILGGVGPAASAYALERLVAICQQEYNAVQDDDFPRIVLTSFPAENVNELGVIEGDGSEDEMVRTLNEGYSTLAAAGVSLVYTACNTISQKTDVMEKLGMRYVNIIEETAAYVAEASPSSKVVVLSSASTRREGLYKTMLDERRVTSQPITDEDQSRVDNLILRAMGGRDIAEAQKDLKALCEEQLKNCDAVVLGCTELSLIAQQREIGKSIIDPQEIALKVLLKEAYS